MTEKELELLEKKSLHSFRVNCDLKDTVIQSNLNNLNRTVKSSVKKKKIIVVVLEDKN